MENRDKKLDIIIYIIEDIGKIPNTIIFINSIKKNIAIMIHS